MKSLACLLLVGALLLPSLCLAANPFSSNVIALTTRNWRREVEDSPHAVFISICRVGCGYCQQLQGEWEKLAKAMKGYAKIAYWDTEQGPAPPLLGEFRGTPTIRLYKPKRKQKAGSNKEKQVVDYNGERKAKDMKKFLEYYMPNFAEQIVNGPKDLEKFQAKAEKHGLPRAMLFVSKADTIPLTKFLTTEFRRKMLIGEVKPTKKNKEIMDKYGVTDLPALVVFPVADEGDEDAAAAEPVRYDGDEFSKNKLLSFLSKYALKKMVVPKKKAEEKADEEKKPEAEKKEEKPQKVKEEL